MGFDKKPPETLSIQFKLIVGAPDDPAENEADARADKVMRMPESNFIQRKCSQCEDEERAQRKPLTSFIQRKETASDAVSNQIYSTKGKGSPIPEVTKSFMENRFDADFCDVRIHRDSSAAQLSKELNAQAFTIGNDIYFNDGKYQPESYEGKHLLAHELTHTIQQGDGVHRHIQRLGTPFGPATGGPSNWSAQVSAATTSAQKAALVQTAAGTGVTVNDATAASASDPVPDPQHLQPFSLTTPVINFDQNLASKHARAGGRALTVNAGYTFQTGSTNYVVIGNAALDPASYNQTVHSINHEFDHVTQYLGHSTLTGNDSELDAWTSSFIREFHHSYQFRPTNNGTTCYVELNSTFAPLLMYYQTVTDAPKRANAVTRISAYFTSTISPNAANTHAFRFWVHQSMRSANNPALGTDVNAALSLNINSSTRPSTYREIPCSSVPAASLPGISTVVMPTAPSTGGTGTTTPSRTGGTGTAQPHPKPQ